MAAGDDNMTTRQVFQEFLGALFAAGLVLLIAGNDGPLSSLFGQVYYLQGAANLNNGAGLTSCRGDLIGWVPPGYTLLLALAHGAGLSFANAGILIAAVCAGGFAWASMRLLLLSVKSPLLVWLGFLTININPIVLKWHLEMTSDALHVGAVMIGLAAGSTYLTSGRRGWIWFAAGAIGVAAVTRFVGVAAIGALACWLLFFSPAGGWRRRSFDAAGFALLASLPLSAFFLFVKLSGGPPGGGRRVVSSPVLNQLQEVFSGLSRWTFNLFGPAIRDVTTEEFRIAVFLTVAAVLLAVALFVTLKSASRIAIAVTWLPGFYAASYFVLMVVLSALLPLDDFTGRYLLPLLGPAAITFVVLLDRCVALSAKRRSVHLAAVGMLTALMIVPANVALSLATGARSFGVHQMMAPAVARSEFLAQARPYVEAGTGITADQETSQLLLAHLGQCVPHLDSNQNPQDAAAHFTHLIRADAWGIELGSLGIAAPRIAFTDKPGLRRPEADAQMSIGTVTPLR